MVSKELLKEGTHVFTSDGKEVGKVNRFVLDPATDEVTHVVVEKGWLLPEDKVVPFEMVASATEDKVVLKENIDDFEKLPPFEESHFVSASAKDTDPTRYGTYPYAPAYYWYPPPAGYIGYPAYGLGYASWPPIEMQRNIPADAVALKEGTDVMSADGKHVGAVDRLFVDPNSNKVTHFLISQGLFKDPKLVPTSWIRSVNEDQVELTVSSEKLERLPAYQA
jgi:uncharacterized protein YrrD